MRLKSLLNKTDFYSYSGITSNDVNDSYVDFVINKVNVMVKQKLSRLFQFSTDFNYKFYGRNSNQIILIDHFQDAGVVDKITVTNGGSGYTTAPTVTISGTATATANVSGGVITSIDVTYQGQPKEYAIAPVITITGGSGANGAATAHISALTVERGTDSNPQDSLTTLVEGEDYRLLYFEDTRPDRTYPVIAIKLYFQPLWIKQFLKVTGTFGFYPDIPLELQLDFEMYEAMKQLLLKSSLDSQNGGRGSVTSSTIDKVSTSWADHRKLTTRDLINDFGNRLDAIVEQYEANSAKYSMSIIG